MLCSTHMSACICKLACREHGTKRFNFRKALEMLKSIARYDAIRLHVVLPNSCFAEANATSHSVFVCVMQKNATIYNLLHCLCMKPNSYAPAITLWNRSTYFNLCWLVVASRSVKEEDLRTETKTTFQS